VYEPLPKLVDGEFDYLQTRPYDLTDQMANPENEKKTP